MTGCTLSGDKPSTETKADGWETGDSREAQDQQINNAWPTLGPNGVDPAAFEALRTRRHARFQSALVVANDPSANLGPTQSKFFRDDFTDCWNTYGSLRGLHASPKARDDFLEMMAQLHSNP